MADQQAPPAGPDLAKGVALGDFSGATLLGHVGDQEVLLVRSGSDIFAIDAHCTPLSRTARGGVGRERDDPLPVAPRLLRPADRRGDACAGLQSALCLEGRARGRTHLRSREARAAKASRQGSRRCARRIVIVGGGAAGFAAAEMLRRQEFRGSIVMLSSETSAPVDRPNLSKDYLAGSAPEDWLPLKSDDFYSDQGIELQLGTEVSAIDPRERNVVLAGGETVLYDRLLLATGAEPVRLPIPGVDQPHVHLLRSLADCRAIIASAEGARRALVIGASFIGLEVAASLRARDIEVHVVGAGAAADGARARPGDGGFRPQPA